MELLERYLWAVGRYLPEATRIDTITELRANLLEPMDARAEETEHPLTDAELVAILKEHGKPEAVALRYLPQRSLIGPNYFPFYSLTLKRGLPFVVVVCAVAEALAFVTTEHDSVAKALLGFIGSTIYSCFVSAAIITLIFVGIEYATRVNKYGSTWNTFDPYKLPAVPRDKRSRMKPRTKRAVDLAVHCLWMAYVVSLHWRLVWHVGNGVIGINVGNLALENGGVAPAPLWHTFWVMLVVILSVQLAAKIITLRDGEPLWLDATTVPLGILAILWLAAHSGGYFVATSAAMSASDLAGVNQGIGIALRVALVFSALGLAKKGWRYYKQRQGAAMLAF